MASRSRSARRPARDVELRARKIRLIVFDLDGVLTDGRILIDARGRETRVFHADDRAGVALMIRAGIRVVALSMRPIAKAAAYARSLRLSAILHGGGDGVTAVGRFCRRHRLTLDAVAYVGHDVVELPLLSTVGLAVAVGDATPHAKRAAHWVPEVAGGDGVARLVGERILRAQGKWASTLGETWRRWE